MMQVYTPAMTIKRTKQYNACIIMILHRMLTRQGQDHYWATQLASLCVCVHFKITKVAIK